MDIADESGFEPLVPLQNPHNRRTGRMSPTASIRVATYRLYQGIRDLEQFWMIVGGSKMPFLTHSGRSIAPFLVPVNVPSIKRADTGMLP